MNAWLKAVNPLAAIDTEAQALMAARASAITLWLSGVAWIVTSILKIQDMPRMRAAMMAEGGESPVLDIVGSGMAEATVVITAVIGLIQLVLGGVQWRSPNTVIPIIFLILSLYGLGNALWGQVTGSAGAGTAVLMILSYFTLVVAVIFHWAGLRGADRLEKIHRVR